MGEEFSAHREALVEIGRHATARALEVAQAAGLDAKVELVVAKPAEALISVADACDATVIVVGTSGESPIKSAMLGSTPHKLLQLSTRPVLCVPAAAERSAQAMSAGLPTSSSVLRSVGGAGRAQLGVRVVDRQLARQAGQATVELRSPR